MADRRHGAAPTPTTSEVSHEDWTGRDISAQIHERVAFVDVNLTDVVNVGASFDECTFRSCRFTASSHTDAAFVNCTFTVCTLTDARFVGCKLVGSMFDRCTFGPLTVTGGDWSFVGLPGADLREARFDSIRMREVDLIGARGQGATLARCDLSGSWLHSADLTRADLRGSDLSSVDPRTTELLDAVIEVEQAITIARALGFVVRT